MHEDSMMKVQRVGKRVTVTFPTEVQAQDFERNLIKVLNEKRRTRAELEQKYSKEINQFKRNEKSQHWAQRR